MTASSLPMSDIIGPQSSVLIIPININYIISEIDSFSITLEIGSDVNKWNMTKGRIKKILSIQV